MCNRLKEICLFMVGFGMEASWTVFDISLLFCIMGVVSPELCIYSGLTTAGLWLLRLFTWRLKSVQRC